MDNNKNTVISEAALDAATDRLEDLLTMLGVNPNEGPAYEEGSMLSTSSETIGRTLARAALEGAFPHLAVNNKASVQPVITTVQKSVLADIRERDAERRAAEAQGIIGGARVYFDIASLLNYIDTQAPLVIDTFEELSDYLQELNYEHGQDATALTTHDGTLFFAFCTDPDGAWCLETGDPTERFEEEDESFVYVPVELDFLRERGPFTINYKAAPEGSELQGKPMKITGMSAPTAEDMANRDFAMRWFPEEENRDSKK